MSAPWLISSPATEFGHRDNGVPDAATFLLHTKRLRLSGVITPPGISKLAPQTTGTLTYSDEECAVLAACEGALFYGMTFSLLVLFGTSAAERVRKPDMSSTVG